MELTHKLVEFFTGEEFFEKGESARLSFSPSELRKIVSLMNEIAKLKAEIKHLRRCKKEF